MNEKAAYLTLDDLYDQLAQHGDITITIPEDQIHVIRRGIAKRKHKEKVSFGEFADTDATFRSTILPQTKDEADAGIVRLRLYLEAKHKVELINLQINDEDF